MLQKHYADETRKKNEHGRGCYGGKVGPLYRKSPAVTGQRTTSVWAAVGAGYPAFYWNPG